MVSGWILETVLFGEWNKAGNKWDGALGEGDGWEEEMLKEFALREEDRLIDGMLDEDITLEEELLE